jgi:hypothetical protein
MKTGLIKQVLIGGVLSSLLSGITVLGLTSGGSKDILAYGPGPGPGLTNSLALPADYGPGPGPGPTNTSAFR